jgi:hypothetical protein
MAHPHTNQFLLSEISLLLCSNNKTCFVDPMTFVPDVYIVFETLFSEIRHKTCKTSQVIGVLKQNKAYKPRIFYGRCKRF